jgi:hypothetical protein
VTFFEPGIVDGLLHRYVRIGSCISHEPTHAPIDVLSNVQINAAADLASQSHFFKFLVMADARLASTKRCHYFIAGITKT